MSYYLYDSCGYVGDLASISGLSALMDYFDEHGGKNLRRLSEKGTVKISKALINELQALADPSDRDIKATLDNFKILVRKSKDIIIITDGIV
jgi:hypothetical protein